MDLFENDGVTPYDQNLNHACVDKPIGNIVLQGKQELIQKQKDLALVQIEIKNLDEKIASSVENKAQLLAERAKKEQFKSQLYADIATIEKEIKTNDATSIESALKLNKSIETVLQPEI